MSKKIPKELLDLKDFELKYLLYLRQKGYRKSKWEKQGPLFIS